MPYSADEVPLDFPWLRGRRRPRLDAMSKIEKPMTFEEFRVSHHDALQAQREHLADDAVAETVLRERGAAADWTPWSANVLATES